jgi:hypothetical protein
MSAAVIDENVPIVANDATRRANGLDAIAAQASDTCRLLVVRYLRELIASGTVVIDEDGLCIARYRKHLAGVGQPGTGDAFLRHVFDNAYNTSRVERVTLTVQDGAFTAFPQNPELATFDLDDRLYVALALSSAFAPELVNAVDSDYRQHAAPLVTAGVKVRELCPPAPQVGRRRPSAPVRRRRAQRRTRQRN